MLCSTKTACFSTMLHAMNRSTYCRTERHASLLFWTITRSHKSLIFKSYEAERRNADEPFNYVGKMGMAHREAQGVESTTDHRPITCTFFAKLIIVTSGVSWHGLRQHCDSSERDAWPHAKLCRKFKEISRVLLQAQVSSYHPPT